MTVQVRSGRGARAGLANPYTQARLHTGVAPALDCRISFLAMYDEFQAIDRWTVSPCTAVIRR